MNTQWHLLKTPRFLPLFITQFLGAFNDNLFKNALIILIAYKALSFIGFKSQELVAIANGIFVLSFFLLSATAGQLADKYEKSRSISIIKFIEIILMVIATIGIYLENIYLLIFVLFLLGMHATFFGPLKYSLLPEQLLNTELIAGNGLLDAGTFISILMGTLLGGALILHPHGKYIICGMMITAAIAGYIASLFIPKTNRHFVKINYNIFTETFSIIKRSATHKDLFLCILGISWFWLIGATFLSTLPNFVKNDLHAQESIVTLFIALFSIGLAAGSLLCNKLLKGKIHATYVPVGALGMTLFTFDLYYASFHINNTFTQATTLYQFLQNPDGWRIIIDLTLIAISGGIYTVPLYATLQNRSPKEYCARIIASNNILNALFMVMSAISVTTMTKLGFSTAKIFLAIAISNGIVAIYICKLLPKFFIKNFFKVILKLL